LCPTRTALPSNYCDRAAGLGGAVDRQSCNHGCMITNRPEHLKAFDYLGLHQYFLTFCTFNRQRHFVESAHVALARTQIARAAGEHCFAITAYCYMPDDVHLLVEGQRELDDRWLRKSG